MRSYIYVKKSNTNDYTLKPNNHTNRPDIIIFNYLTAAYRYLVSERKRYFPKTASYHSMSAALYNLDRLIQKYWPNSKGYKETPLYEENQNDNYLDLWYTFMTKACSRHNNFLDMVSVIVFIRDLPVSDPKDKRPVNKENNDTKPLVKRTYDTFDYDKILCEALLQRLESARWCIITASKMHALTHDEKPYRIAKQSSLKIEAIMQSICNTYGLNLKNYKSTSLIDDPSIFDGNCGQKCISILNGIISEINNGKLSNFNLEKEKTAIKNLVKTLTPIYYK